MILIVLLPLITAGIIGLVLLQRKLQRKHLFWVAVVYIAVLILAVPVFYLKPANFVVLTANAPDNSAQVSNDALNGIIDTSLGVKKVCDLTFSGPTLNLITPSTGRNFFVIDGLSSQVRQFV